MTKTMVKPGRWSANQQWSILLDDIGVDICAPVIVVFYQY
jgi:hypothetical protein